MKLKLNKKKLKNLSKDNNALPADMTPQVGGGRYTHVCRNTLNCNRLSEDGCASGGCISKTNCGTDTCH
ncbi:hypothetical protein [Pseudoalteromonas denitrificans]|uniref:Uncharacterized protein n=1 Tax=Pseudoalteromonas denitrificans DSM 6059 TaxID=1123010 RepID=A0A1I1QCT8_9GAMM|nr:hypothetical protein [Pseudoalteromonas denitrificans]SFD19964.1 hypothetical protein SAMN02745724_03842 [Pseudoalteromonas denitrificans DSM 6059]